MIDTELSRRQVIAGAIAAGVAPSLLSQSASAQTTGDGVGCTWLADQSANGYVLQDLGALTWDQVDVRNIDSPAISETRYHDGSGTDNPEGPAFYRSTNNGEWVSIVDGTVIS